MFWWYHENGIWNGPLYEMPSDATPIPQKPDPCASWDYDNMQWVPGCDFPCPMNTQATLKEIDRLHTFLTPGTNLQPAEIAQVTAYKQALINYMKDPHNVEKPVCPYCASFMRLGD